LGRKWGGIAEAFLNRQEENNIRSPLAPREQLEFYSETAK
jgi:hypothetical protein